MDDDNQGKTIYSLKRAKQPKGKSYHNSYIVNNVNLKKFVLN